MSPAAVAVGSECNCNYKHIGLCQEESSSNQSEEAEPARQSSIATEHANYKYSLLIDIHCQSSYFHQFTLPGDRPVVSMLHQTQLKNM